MVRMIGMRFFRTGDLGRFVDNRFLKVTGRIKELYKLENGKYVTPVPLEDSICRSQFVAQALVFGSDKKFNTALIVPDFLQVTRITAPRCSLRSACVIEIYCAGIICNLVFVS